MELSIKNHNSINFQASKRKTQKGNEYYHSNKALVAGGATCALATGLSALITHNKKIPNSKKTILAWFGLTAPLILMGAIADKLTNKERQKTADLIAEVGVENAQLIDDKLKVSKNGNLYKPTGNATLIGGVGLIGILTLSGISHLLFKKGVVKNEIFKHFGFLAKMFTEAGPSDEISALIAAFPAVLPILPLIGSDWLNNQESKKKS
ncbi:MAG: hypothetical protein IJZ26_03075 [Clostridia bacterium]|nr:hypothetical protein [Clostridia bacterium]